MKKGKKVKAQVRLDSNRSIEIEGKIQDTRVVFGREEYLVDVTKIAPIWITKEKLS